MRFSLTLLVNVPNVNYTFIERPSAVDYLVEFRFYLINFADEICLPLLDLGKLKSLVT